MGRGRGRGKPQRLMRRDFGKGENNGDRPRGHNANYLQPADLHNAAFEEYYKTQDIVPEGEWAAFMTSLQTPLPITFRINGSGQFAKEVREKLETDFFAHFSHGAITVDGETLQPPHALPWYPDNLAWHMAFSRGQLRKLPWLSDIHEWMKKANDSGTITRQEAVSMVPPLLLDVQPHHRVLDMCAAPGSKTFQLLEMLHTSPADASSSSSVPPGFVVANDADAQRCNLLTHQTKRMCSPCLMITNHEGQTFPKVLPLQPNSTEAAVATAAGLSAAVAQPGEAGEALLYDRILCDVPCSGDGTLRKAPDIWRRWSINNGNGLHSLQLRIALQGVRLLKVGGRMVYSTCTFNPIEDEAVVAELLVRAKGALQLVDCSAALPNLKRLPGKKTWKVRDRHSWYSTWEEAEPVSNKLDPTMFCNPEKAALPLERTMRLLPHHQDTGGFFVAVLEKVAPTGPMPDPSRAHRFTQQVKRSNGETLTLEGLDPLTGAKKAAEAALECATQAVAALEGSDAAAAQAALARAEAAADRAKQAQEAAAALVRSAEHQGRQQQQQGKRGGGREQAAGAGEEVEMEEAEAGGADGAAAAAVEEDMEEAEPSGAAATADGEEEQVPDAEAGTTAAAAAAAAGGGGGSGQQEQDKQPWVPTWVRGGGRRGRQGGGGRFTGIDPIIPIQDPEIIEMLTSFYGVEPGFPLSTHLITRSADAAWPKRLYFVSDALLALLLADDRESLKITSTGLKVFERHDLKGGVQAGGGKCHYRIAQEGLPFLLPHLTRQILRLGLDDFLRLLQEKNLPLEVTTAADPAPAAAGAVSAPVVAAAAAVLVEKNTPEAAAAGAAASAGAAADGSKKGKPPKQAYLSTPAALEQLKNVQSGGAVVVLEEADAKALGFSTVETSGALTANAPMAVSAWRTPASLSTLVPKENVDQMIDKIKAAKAKLRAIAAAQ